MPRDEVAFVRFLAQRYHALRGLMAVAVGLAVVAAAPLLTRDWTARDGMSLGVVVAGLVIAAIFIHRYYDDSFGRARATVRTSAAAVAHDPAAALMLTALTTCEEADIRFLANIAGLHPAEADARVQALRQAELIGIHEEGRRTRRVQFAKLTTGGVDVAAHLWPERLVFPAH